MSKVKVVFFREGQSVPVLSWLAGLRRQDRKAFAKCMVRIRELAEFGHELRRPAADYLRDGIYELRAKQGRTQYRVLYFFHGRMLAILAQGLVKKGGKVPGAEIDRAVKRKRIFQSDPDGHRHEEDLE